MLTNSGSGSSSGCLRATYLEPSPVHSLHFLQAFTPSGLLFLVVLAPILVLLVSEFSLPDFFGVVRSSGHVILRLSVIPVVAMIVSFFRYHGHFQHIVVTISCTLLIQFLAHHRHHYRTFRRICLYHVLVFFDFVSKGGSP